MLFAIFASLIVFPCGLFSGKYKEIYFSSPQYLQRKSKPWTKGGRIVGILKNPPPKFVVEIYSDSSGRVVWTGEFGDKVSVYETAFLPPGLYTMEVKADGFDKSFFRSFKVQAMADCLVNIEFGTTAYTRNY